MSAPTQPSPTVWSANNMHKKPETPLNCPQVHVHKT